MSIEVITIQDSATGSQASLAPSLGFNCFSFLAKSHASEYEVLWSDPEFTSGTARPSRSGIPILFPFAGRIRGGSYRFEGREYELELAPGTTNAIHGFVYTRAWRVVKQSSDLVIGEFQASIDDPTILRRWPSDFRICASYKLQGNTLLSNYEFTNTGSAKLPWWFGTHPYFRCDRNSVIQVPVTKRWNLRDLLPTGELSTAANATELAIGSSIGDQEFDEVFTGLGFSGGKFTGSVTNQHAGWRTSIEFSDAFPECVLFTAPHREAVCIEPYSSAPNAFELEEFGISTGLQTLAPGESKSVDIVIRAERIS